ncbi:hypothetical protein H0H87_001905 [Tephrocybe sp. NHM501043]|nr:hypothetical protein H0H87_001905 [Tephrocybe sp. NHM501043]
MAARGIPPPQLPNSRLQKLFRHLSPSPSLKQSLRRTSLSLFATTKTSLDALYLSADACPPLKSVCGGVLAIWDTVERMKSSKKVAEALALRCFEILNEVAAPVMNQSDLSPAVKQKLSKFTDLLNDIKISLDSIQGQKWSRRFKHLNRNQDLLRVHEKRLNEAYQDLSSVVALQTHLAVKSRSKQSVVEFNRTNTALQLTNVALQQIASTTAQTEHRVEAQSRQTAAEFMQTGAKLERVSTTTLQTQLLVEASSRQAADQFEKTQNLFQQVTITHAATNANVEAASQQMDARMQRIVGYPPSYNHNSK